jgi:hypothetical protein
MAFFSSDDSYTAVIDRNPTVDRSHDPSGPHIRCPLCGWSPGKGGRWRCTSCGHAWNTFDSGGVCPGCLYQWMETQCLACARWSPHSAWYGE